MRIAKLLKFSFPVKHITRICLTPAYLTRDEPVDADAASRRASSNLRDE